jgi:formylglycine-generating enzyme
MPTMLGKFLSGGAGDSMFGSIVDFIKFSYCAKTVSLLPICLSSFGKILIIAGVIFSVMSPGQVKAQSETVPEITDGMVLIPAGKFTMGCSKFGHEHGFREHEVFVSDFLIDRYEVTNEQYEKIVVEHGERRSPFSKCDNCPVSKVSWYEAADYCYLIGKSLPTEAQWEKAAGATNGCEFPWGDEFDPTKDQARGGLKLRDNTSPVGSYPPNKYGLHDMAGNMWEWVADWFSIHNLPPEVLYNPKGLSRGTMKVRRGGAWSDSVNAMRTGWRDRSHPFSRGLNDIGFRCAVNLIRK